MKRGIQKVMGGGSRVERRIDRAFSNEGVMIKIKFDYYKIVPGIMMYIFQGVFVFVLFLFSF